MLVMVLSLPFIATKLLKQFERIELDQFKIPDHRAGLLTVMAVSNSYSNA